MSINAIKISYSLIEAHNFPVIPRLQVPSIANLPTPHI